MTGTRQAPAPTREEVLTVLQDDQHDGHLWSARHIAQEISRRRGFVGDMNDAWDRMNSPVLPVRPRRVQKLVAAMVEDGVLAFAIDTGDRTGDRDPALAAVGGVAYDNVRYYGLPETLASSREAEQRRQALLRESVALSAELNERHGDRVLELSVHNGTVIIHATPAQARVLFGDTVPDQSGPDGGMS